MASTPATPRKPRRRPLWQRVILICLNCVLASVALWLGMSIPSYFRSVSPLVLEAAAAGTETLPERADDLLQAGRPGLAEALLEAHQLSTGNDIPTALRDELETLYSENPAYRWSGGPAPYFEQFVRQAPFLREDETRVLPALLPAEHRRELLGFLRESPNRNVQRILDTRGLGGWARFYPVYSTSGHPLEATILTTALLEQASAIPDGIRRDLLAAVEGAMEGNPWALRELESLYIGILTLGRYSNWLLLKELMLRFESPEHLLFTAQATQENPQRLALVFSALQAARQTDRLVDYLVRHDERGWAALTTALSMGGGAVEALIQFDRPVYHPPGFWDRLPEFVRQSQQGFKNFAETWPGLAIAGRALSFALCGFFLVGVLRILILGGQPRDHQRRVLINLDSLVGGVLVMMLVWVLIEPGLLDFRPNEQGSLQIRLAQVVPESPLPETESPASTMIDQVTILVLLLFLVLQLLVFIFGLLKIAEVRRRTVPPEVKLHLLDNEENLFDLGLYVGLGGTVASLILVVLNVVDASLMAAYASTLFGIIFVAILKVGFLRPYRRSLILQRAKA